MEANNMKTMREASAPVPCDHVLTLDEAIAHAEECADNTPCGSQHRQLADWLKELKTLKTSVSCGNTAAMREAAKYVQSTMERLRDPTDKNNAEFIRIWEIVSAALAAPTRNCDVGTAEEQSERFENFCLRHIGCAEETGGRHCVGCPLEKASRNITQKCELYWAQMPYEEGGIK